MSDPALPQLAHMTPHFFWTEDSGMIVSPNVRELPPLPSQLAQAKGDPTVPRLIPNSRVYELFYPRLVVNRGPLFGRLDVTRSQLERFVVEIPVVRSGPTPLMGWPAQKSRYILHEDIVRSWSRLENALIETAYYLIRTNKRSSKNPVLTMPKFPQQYGYRTHHASRAIVLNCAEKARDAFPMLSALVTFSLSLWLRRDKNTCFEDAFHILHTGLGSPRCPYEWLSSMENSYVCNLSSGMRTGGFIDPYETMWAELIPHFVAAGVPLWFVWGREYNSRDVLQVKITDRLFPKDDDVEDAQRRARYEPLVPSYAPPPLQYSQYAQHDREEDGVPSLDYSNLSPKIERGSRQREGENFDEFVARMTVERERYILKEKEGERQSRQSREENASRGHRAKACAIFEWEQEGSFWRRVRVPTSDVENTWHDYPASQRLYWGHLNEWDMCPQTPQNSGGVEILDDMYPYNDDDEPILPISSHSYAQSEGPEQIPQVHLNPSTAHEDMNRDLDMMNSIVDESTNKDVMEDTAYGPWDFIDYLYKWHGFQAMTNYPPTCSLHIRTNSVSVNEYGLVARYLCYPKHVPQRSFAESIIEFHNIIVNPKIDLNCLPVSWDISSDATDTLRLEREGFTWAPLPSIKGDLLYIIRENTAQKGDWVVATYEPEVLLLSFRLLWTSMSGLVRQLLQRGVCFYMPRLISRADAGPPLDKPTSRGLGWRPRDYEPDYRDYPAYARRRDEVLRTTDGRSCRIYGGIVARLARHVVTEADVLQGPSYCDLIMCTMKNDCVLAEDDITAQTLDIVCGVYFVDNAPDGSNLMHLSWWPKSLLWERRSGFHVGEWTPDAEEWYQDTLAKRELRPAGAWREQVKKYFSRNKAILEGTRRLASHYSKVVHSRRS